MKKTLKRVAATTDLWTDAPTEVSQKHVLMVVYGDENTGKTTLAFTAPGSVAYIHFGEKVTGVMERAAKRKKTKGHKVRFVSLACTFNPEDSAEKIAKEMGKVFDKFIMAWFDAFKWADTIILDTGTDAWELFRLAYFGGLKPVSGRVETNWGIPNMRWRSLFKEYLIHQKTVVVIDKTRNQWTPKKAGKQGQRTGRTEHRCQDDVPFFAEVIVRMEHQSGGDFEANIEKGWYNAECENKPVVNHACNFPTVMHLVTGMGVENWIDVKKK